MKKEINNKLSLTTKPPKIASPSTRSSAAEYLTFISAGGENSESVELRYEDENIWMTQKMMAELYGVSVPTINHHIKSLENDSELDNSVIRQYLTTAADGKNYSANHYGLQATISIGFKIENEKSVQFRKWAREIVKEYTIKGFAMQVFYEIILIFI